MKKILTLCVIAFSIFMISCQSKTDRLINVLTEGSKEINDCKSMEEMQSVEAKIQNEIFQIVGDNEDFKFSDDERKKLEPALTEYYQTFYKKAGSFQTPETMESPSTDSITE